MTDLDVDATASTDETPPPVEVLDAPPGALAIPDDPAPVSADTPLSGVNPTTGLSIVPNEGEFQRLAQLATTLAYADACPGALSGKPNDVLLVLLTARDLNVALTMAMREFHVIDGRVTLSPKSKLAMVRASNLGRCWPDPDNDDQTATWYATRSDMPADVVFAATYTRAMAERAKLVGKDNWVKYPERMLSWRACGYLMDDVFGEVATGMYSPDELGAQINDEGEIIDVAGVGVLPGMTEGRNRNRNRKAKASTAAAPDPVADDADKADIHGRIEALRALSPDARAAVLSIWNDKELGKLDELPARKVAVAKGIVASVEARAKKGEWGVWDQNATTPAVPATTSPEPATLTDPPPPPPNTADEHEPDPDAELAMMVAEAGSWNRATLVENAKALGVSTSGAMPVILDRYVTELRRLRAEEVGGGE